MCARRRTRPQSAVGSRRGIESWNGTRTQRESATVCVTWEPASLSWISDAANQSELVAINCRSPPQTITPQNSATSVTANLISYIYIVGIIMVSPQLGHLEYYSSRQFSCQGIASRPCLKGPGPDFGGAKTMTSTRHSRSNSCFYQIQQYKQPI